MKYALINGERKEAQKGNTANCPNCEKPMIAKCGEKKIHHWAHKGSLECDPWWENETEWHRKWKSFFPSEWQEFIQRSENGEKHIADVRTNQGWIIEFQHSYLNPSERRSRNEFYKKLIWVVDGKRLQSNEIVFAKALNEGETNDVFIKIFLRDCPFLNDWIDCHYPVFFDFGEPKNHLQSTDLWAIFPGSPGDIVFVKSFPRESFLEIFLCETSEKSLLFEKCLNDWKYKNQKLSQIHVEKMKEKKEEEYKKREEKFRKDMDAIHLQAKAKRNRTKL